MASGAGHTNLQPPFRGGAATEAAGVKPTKAVGKFDMFFLSGITEMDQFFQIDLFESYRGFFHGVETFEIWKIMDYRG